MRNFSLALGIALFSFSAISGVSIKEKESRLKYLEKPSKKIETINIDAYRREFKYEKKGLALEDRASNEALLMAEKVKTQLADAYAEAQKENSSHPAVVKELMAAVENDIAPAAPEVKEELRKLAQTTLDALEDGTVSTDTDLSGLEAALLSRVAERSKFFNEEFAVNQAKSLSQAEPKHSYKSKKELLDVLASEGPNSPYVSGATMSLNSGSLTSHDTTISLYVKLEFKGVYIDAGPSVTFTREWNSFVNILAEGSDPILDSRGYFDFFVNKGGKQVRRHMIFTCQAGLFFQTKTAITVGVGAGASSSILAPVGAWGSVRAEQASSQRYSNSVNLSSRQIYLPDHIGKTPTTLQMLNEICHKDYLNARTQGGLTMKGSLDNMMKNVVASLRYHHPKTTCTVDQHCFDWYNGLGLIRVNNYPRCILDEKSGEFAYCALRGLKGQTCTVYEYGRRVSTDQFEFTCDAGLTCYKVREASWFLEGLTGRLWSAPKGECH